MRALPHGILQAAPFINYHPSILSFCSDFFQSLFAFASAPFAATFAGTISPKLICFNFEACKFKVCYASGDCRWWGFWVEQGFCLAYLQGWDVSDRPFSEWWSFLVGFPHWLPKAWKFRRLETAATRPPPQYSGTTFEVCGSGWECDTFCIPTTVRTGDSGLMSPSFAW